MKKLIIGNVIVVVLILLLIFGKEFYAKEAVLRDINNVAVVNQDQPVLYNDEYLKASEFFINSLNNSEDVDVSIVNETRAQEGIKNNIYSVEVLFPSNFTENVISINDKNPIKAPIIIKYNEKLTTEQLLDIQEAMDKFLFYINNTLNYVFVYGIFEGVNETKNYSDLTTEAAEENITNFDEISNYDLLADKSYELVDFDNSDLEYEKNKFEEEKPGYKYGVDKVELSEEKAGYIGVVNAYKAAFEAKMQEFRESYEAQFGDMDANLGDIKANLDGVQNTVDSLKWYLNYLEAKELGLTPTLDQTDVDLLYDLYDIMENLEVISSANNRNSKIVKDYNDLRGKIDLDDSMLKDLSDTEEDLNTFIESIKTCSVDNGEVFPLDLTLCSGSLNDLNSIISDISTIQQQLGNIKTRLTTMKTQKEIKQTDYNYLVNNLQTGHLNTELGIRKILGNLDTQMGNINNNISTIFDSLTSINNYLMFKNIGLPGNEFLYNGVTKTLIISEEEKLLWNGYELKDDCTGIANCIVVSSIYDSNTTTNLNSLGNTFNSVFDELKEEQKLKEEEEKLLDNKNKITSTGSELLGISNNDLEFIVEDGGAVVAPNNIFAYMSGYSYCQSQDDPSDIKSTTGILENCGAGYDKVTKSGILGYKLIIDRLIIEMYRLIGTMPDLESVDKTEYIELLKEINLDVMEELVDTKEQNYDNALSYADDLGDFIDRLLENTSNNQDLALDYILENVKRVDEYSSQNVDNIEDYVDSIEGDDTLDKLRDQYLNNTEENTDLINKSMASIMKILPNSNINGLENIALYNFISNPIEVQNKSTEKELMEEVKANSNIIILLILIIILFVIIAVVTIISKRKG